MHNMTLQTPFELLEGILRPREVQVFPSAVRGHKLVQAIVILPIRDLHRHLVRRATRHDTPPLDVETTAGRGRQVQCRSA